MYAGTKIIEDPNLVEPGPPVVVKRTWKERLFSLPWTPWRSEKTITPMVPIRDVFVLPTGGLLMHPETAERLRQAVKERQQQQFWSSELFRPPGCL